MAHTGFSDYWFDEKFQDLPLMLYFPKTKVLDLTRTPITIIPAGLKGVDVIRLEQKPSAIAPDYKGEISYEWGVGCRSLLTDWEVEGAKAVYKRHKKFCETPHTWAGYTPHRNYANLPKNMAFITVDGRTILDLRHSDVALKRKDLCVIGINAVILPSDSAMKAERILRRIQSATRQNIRS